LTSPAGLGGSEDAPKGQEPRLVQDSEAGFWRVDPTPSPETLRDLYDHEYYARDKPFYLEKTARELEYWRAVWGVRLEAMAPAIGGPGRLLDIGASGGFFLALADELGWAVAGVEPSRQSAAYARNHFQFPLFNGYLEDYPIENGPYDAIHIALVLEHVRDPRAFLRRALALLRPGGVIWVETPNDFNPLQAAIVDQMDKPRWWIVPRHHLNYFDFDSLSRLLAQLGAVESMRLASFPMECFALMGLDYIGHEKNGARAHAARMRFEGRLLEHDPGLLLRLYRQLAAAGLGRTCNVMAVKA